MAQAVLPIREMTSLFARSSIPANLLLGLTVMIVIVSGIGILVSIYNSMSERHHEIAVMRALGAGRRTVMLLVLLESILLSLGGGLLGWIVGHALIAALVLGSPPKRAFPSAFAVCRLRVGYNTGIDRLAVAGGISAGDGRLPNRRRPKRAPEGPRLGHSPLRECPLRLASSARSDALDSPYTSGARSTTHDRSSFHESPMSGLIAAALVLAVAAIWRAAPCVPVLQRRFAHLQRGNRQLASRGDRQAGRAAPGPKDAAAANNSLDVAKAKFEILKILKGEKELGSNRKIETVYFGDSPRGHDVS